MLETGLKIFSDDDKQTAFLGFVKGTQSHLRIVAYGPHPPKLIAALMGLYKQGKDVALVIDHIQDRRTYENP